MTAQPRPALRRAADADIHPALAAAPAQESPALRSRTPLAVTAAVKDTGTLQEPGDGKGKAKAKARGKAKAKAKAKPKAKAKESDEGRFRGAGRTTSDTVRINKKVDLGVTVPKSVRKELRATAAASGITTDELVAEILMAWLAESRRW